MTEKSFQPVVKLKATCGKSGKMFEFGAHSNSMDSFTNSLSIGVVLNEIMQQSDFDIDWNDVLGEGMFGKVYSAVHRHSLVKVAIKACSTISRQPVRSDGRSARSALVDEVALHEAISHPHIVDFLGWWGEAAQSSLFIVLELCEGGNLYSYLKKCHSVPENRSLLVMQQLLSALHYLHSARRIVHRDLKLSNILIHSQDGDGNLLIKLCDMGLAAPISHPDEELSDFCGTANYISPEMADGQLYSYPVDIWAAGVVLYYLVTGKSPFGRHNDEKATLQAISAGKYVEPADLTTYGLDLLKHMLVVDPRKRSTAQQLLGHRALLDEVTTTRTDLDIAVNCSGSFITSKLYDSPSSPATPCIRYSEPVQEKKTRVSTKLTTTTPATANAQAASKLIEQRAGSMKRRDDSHKTKAISQNKLFANDQALNSTPPVQQRSVLPLPPSTTAEPRFNINHAALDQPKHILSEVPAAQSVPPELVLNACMLLVDACDNLRGLASFCFAGKHELLVYSDSARPQLLYVRDSPRSTTRMVLDVAAKQIYLGEVKGALVPALQALREDAGNEGDLKYNIVIDGDLFQALASLNSMKEMKLASADSFHTLAKGLKRMSVLSKDAADRIPKRVVYFPPPEASSSNSKPMGLKCMVMSNNADPIFRIQFTDEMVLVNDMQLGQIQIFRPNPVFQASISDSECSDDSFDLMVALDKKKPDPNTQEYGLVWEGTMQDDVPQDLLVYVMACQLALKHVSTTPPRIMPAHVRYPLTQIEHVHDLFSLSTP